MHPSTMIAMEGDKYIARLLLCFLAAQIQITGRKLSDSSPPDRGDKDRDGHVPPASSGQFTLRRTQLTRPDQRLCRGKQRHTREAETIALPPSHPSPHRVSTRSLRRTTGTGRVRDTRIRVLSHLILTFHALQQHKAMTTFQNVKKNNNKACLKGENSVFCSEKALRVKERNKDIRCPKPSPIRQSRIDHEKLIVRDVS